jgi:hypothetical protein
MIAGLPMYISIVFIFTTLITVFFFHRAAGRSTTALLVLLSWLGIQAAISLTGFYYTETREFPPRFLLLVLPPFLTIILLFFIKKGKRFIDNLELQAITLLHIIRIPVELVLLWLYNEGTVPELMTFEGRNFDIFSGLTAPVVAWYCFRNGQVKSGVLLAWNIACLLLLINIVANAVLSAPFAFQQFAFEQPNTAVLYFPFVWLPCCVVPIVLLCHLAAIRRLLPGFKGSNGSVGIH